MIYVLNLNVIIINFFPSVNHLEPKIFYLPLAKLVIYRYSVIKLFCIFKVIQWEICG